MAMPLTVILISFSILPSLYTSEGSFHHRSSLDTNPDPELNPVRPKYRTTTTENAHTVNDEFKLPEPPYRHLKEDLLDSDYGYGYDYDHNDGSSGTIHNHNKHYYDMTSSPPEFQVDYTEDGNSADGHKDHLTNASTSIARAWFIVVLSLFLTKVAVLIQ